MSAYVIINNEILDDSAFTAFRQRISSTVESHGGKYLVRGGEVELVEGSWSVDRVVVVEFADVSGARAWLNSEEYKELKKIRERCANANIVIVQGV